MQSIQMIQIDQAETGKKRKLVRAKSMSTSRLLLRYCLIACCALLFVALDAVQSKLAWALSLGPAQVHSSLGSPLFVTLELNHLKNISIEQLKASAATDDYYEKMGINPASVTRGLKLKIEKNDKGKTQLAITSAKRFTEPFVNFVVHIRWPKGELLKEITLLINPPKMAQ